MIVREKIPIHTDGQHFIEFGTSTWTENAPEEEQTESIRRRYEGETGRFSPHGSSEIPMEDMGLLITECIRRDRISIEEMSIILNAIADSIRRQAV